MGKLKIKKVSKRVSGLSESDECDPSSDPRKKKCWLRAVACRT